MESPISSSVGFLPGESSVSFNGTITITKTTITAFKTSSNKEPIFIGVCSIPLIQFYRHKNMLTLMRGGAFLFDNASDSLGSNHNNNNKGMDNPSTWETLTIQFSSLANCDKVVEALTHRRAEEVFSPPLPLTNSVNKKKNHDNNISPSDYDNNNSSEDNYYPNDNNNNKYYDDEATTSASRLSSRPQPRQSQSNRQAYNNNNIDDDATQSSLQSSRLPSRRSNSYGAGSRGHNAYPNGYDNNNNDDDATQSSLQSSRLPSRRSHSYGGGSSAARPRNGDDDNMNNNGAYDRATPSRQSSIISRRSSLPERRTPGRDGASLSSQQSRPSQTNRYYPHQRGAVEREFQPMSSQRRTRSAQEPQHGRQPVQESDGRNTNTNNNTNTSPSRERRERPRSSSRHHSRSPKPRPNEGVANNNNNNNDYTNSDKDKEVFWRSILKLQHHRLHFMQYLHKEMVHQAFLAEEAKVKAFYARQPPQGPNNNNNNNNNKSASMEQELQGQLREVERRLSEVEGLHTEAERERDAAARLRRELEWKIDELNNCMPPSPQQPPQQQQQPSQSRDINTLNNYGNSSRRSSQYNPNNHINNSNMSSPQHPYPNGNYAVALAPEYNNGALMVPQPQYGIAPYYSNNAHNNNFSAPDERDFARAITDRYVFGSEWARLYPSHASDVRFNAQIDVCLALKLPRRLVEITSLAVDQPGLRVTAEVRYDAGKMDRPTLERRVATCPFQFLTRMYEMRDILDPQNTNNNNNNNANNNNNYNAIGNKGGRYPPIVNYHPNNNNYNNNNRGSRYPTAADDERRGRHASRTGSSRRQPRDPSSSSRGGRNNNNNNRHRHHDDGDNDDLYDYYAGASPTYRHSEERMDKRRRKLKAEVRQQLERYLRTLMEQEHYDRHSLQLDEAKAWKALRARRQEAHAGSASARAAALRSLQEEEEIERAAAMLAEARQRQVLHRVLARQEALAAVVAGERAGRAALRQREASEREQLSRAMAPAVAAARWALELQDSERRQRLQLSEAEAAARQRLQSHIREFRIHCYNEELQNVVAEEQSARAIIHSDMLAAVVGLLAASPANSAQGRRARTSAAVPSDARAALAQLLKSIVDDEKRERDEITKEAARRSQLYALDGLERREAVLRGGLEIAELDAWGALMDRLGAETRALLQRLREAADQRPALAREEEYRRGNIRNEEQDDFEAIAELFGSELKRLLAQAAERAAAAAETPRRRRLSLPRVAKEFHYMTFEPEDMDYAPSAILAIEGMLGCAINKNLEVTTITRPLPKVSDDDLLFQSGDMILDVAGHSLHSLSHLREVLSTRAMLIKEVVLGEFPDVPEEERTTNPALQKYLEVVCEHHNYLVQVLRGCDIYQIIVKS